MSKWQFILSCLLCFQWCSNAAEPSVEDAVKRGLARITQAASDWPKHKTCFSCHHQTLPMLSMIEASHAGIPLDKAWLQVQADITHRYHAQRIETMLAGEHVPGGSTTVGYAFWALKMTGRPADATTTAMVTYLLKIQGAARLNGDLSKDLTQLNNGRWLTSCRRPPMQGADIADTVLALHGMKQYATAEQEPAVLKARAAAEKWLAQAPLITQEDHIWRLWGLYHDHAEEAEIEARRAAILKLQQTDGGWASSAEYASDAFSTGETLHVMLESGLPRDHSAMLRARDWLLKTQYPDGSWLVESRVKNKAQPYFENGDPHGENQFLSTAATAWAVAGLARLLPPKQP